MMAVLALGASTSLAGATFWKPVTAEELALEHPRIDREAGVEILFREAEVDDSAEDLTTYRTYVRLKVFDARGLADLDQIALVGTRDNPVINVAARVIRRDGSVVDVRRESIHTREVLRHGSVRVRARAFSFPALEPGCIVEYQWEERSEDGIGGLQLYFQDRFPAWRVRFRIKPFNYRDRGYQVVPAGFRYEIPELRADDQGFYAFEQNDVPAVRDEPWMPPDDMVQSWLVLYFLRQGQTAAEYWRDAGRAWAQENQRLTRPDRAIDELARTLAAPSGDSEETLRRFGRFCQEEITNRTLQPLTTLAETMPARPGRPQSAAATLATRAGTSDEINGLFLALARSAGFDARLACVTDRSKRMFREPLPARFMLPDRIAAVRVGESWRFFDAGHPHVAPGGLAWKNEGVTALVCARDQTEFVSTPRTARADSRVTRSARLVLDESGTATGFVRLEYHGHPAVDLRQKLAGHSPEEHAAHVYREEVRRREGAVIADVTVDNLAQPELPLVISYQVRVPQLAAATGSRLVFPLAYFQRGDTAVFTAPRREHVIYLPYESTEDDLVEYVLPAGWHAPGATAPSSFGLLPALEYRTQLDAAEGGRLIFRRTVSQGGMIFPATTYRLFRQAFDDLHRQDSRAVVAERTSVPAPSQP